MMAFGKWKNRGWDKVREIIRWLKFNDEEK